MKNLRQWKGCARPSADAMQGRYVRLEPMADERHLEDIYQAYAEDIDGDTWAYLPYGPFADRDAFFRFARETYFGADPMFHAVIDRKTGKAAGVASLMRINADHGVIEVGHICYAPVIQRTPVTTEAVYLLGCRIFDELGYRRFEWKCNAANEASTRAAKRFGFSFEGTFRQALVVKGNNRDTAWFSMLDHEWAVRKAGFEAWLDPKNFDENGQQKSALDVYTR